MANKRLPMRKIKEVLRLKYVCGLGEREIAHSCRVSRATVGNYLKRAEAAGLSGPLVAGLSEAELESRLFLWGNSPADPQRPLPDCQYIYDQLRDHKKVNLTLTQLWLEYKSLLSMLVQEVVNILFSFGFYLMIRIAMRFGIGELIIVFVVLVSDMSARLSLERESYLSGSCPAIWWLR